MKGEQTTEVVFPVSGELPLSLSARSLSPGNQDEMGKLRSENLRLQLLVAELLAENQQLRQRNCGSKAL
ncbi:MAG TPA: hypothetical protein VNU92_17395 [Edaphobacter sp.]|jgi:hypothetical protein|nr:hypothetical protein [Edaphobacter sp.]